MKPLHFFIYLVFFNTYSQIQYSKWPIQNNKIINFPEFGTPSVTGNIVISPFNPNNWRSTTAISDSQGELKLFSSPDGIFNSNGVPIDNTQFTNSVSSVYNSQSLVLKQPGSKSYYVIHSNNRLINGIQTQLLYSKIDNEVDFSSQDLIYDTQVFEQPLSPGFNNSLFTAYYNSQQNTYYIVSFGSTIPHGLNNTIFVHKLDCSGISFVNQFSFSFPGVINFDSGKRGDIKFNSSGTNLYLSVNSAGSSSFPRIYSFDFNNGVVSNPLPLPHTNQNSILAFEVSYNGDYLYYFMGNRLLQSRSSNYDIASLYQYDLKSFNTTNSSPDLLWTGPYMNVDIQIANDKEIYVGIAQPPNNSTINSTRDFLHKIQNSNTQNGSFLPNFLNVQSVFIRNVFPVLIHGGYPESLGYPIVHGQNIADRFDHVVATTFDSSRNVYTIGTKNVGVGFYNNQTTVNALAYLNKYDKCGNLLFSKNLSASYDIDKPVDLKFDFNSNNSLILLGTTGSNVTKVTKIKTNGNQIWETIHTNLESPSMDVNSTNGDIYISGSFSSDLDSRYTNTIVVTPYFSALYNYRFSSMDSNGRWLGWSDNLRSTDPHLYLRVGYASEVKSLYATSTPTRNGTSFSDSGAVFAHTGYDALLHKLDVDGGLYSFNDSFSFNSSNNTAIVIFDVFKDGRIVSIDRASRDINFLDSNGMLVATDNVGIYFYSFLPQYFTNNLIQIEENAENIYIAGILNGEAYSLIQYDYNQRRVNWIKDLSYYNRNAHYSSLAVSEGEVVVSGQMFMNNSTTYDFDGFLGYNDDYYSGSIVVNRIQNLYTTPIYKSSNKLVSEYENELIIYPNPNRGVFKISKKIDFKIYDLSGRVINYNITGDIINIINFKRGIYLLVPNDKNLSTVKLFLK